jgi:hypothetical protein
VPSLNIYIIDRPDHVYNDLVIRETTVPAGFIDHFINENFGGEIIALNAVKHFKFVLHILTLYCALIQPCRGNLACGESKPVKNSNVPIESHTNYQ